MFNFVLSYQIVLDAQDGEKLKSFSKKIRDIINLFMSFVNSSTTTLTRKLNKISRDYRYVIRTLAVEKKTLKVFILFLFLLKWFLLTNVHSSKTEVLESV